jgi:hypothetical protein
MDLRSMAAEEVRTGLYDGISPCQIIENNCFSGFLSSIDTSPMPFQGLGFGGMLCGERSQSTD